MMENSNGGSLPDNGKTKTVIDFVSGVAIPDVGAEANRQQIERLLVEVKGYDKKDIEVDAPIRVDIGDEAYRSWVDLVVKVRGRPFLVIVCAAGSLASREREALAAARLLDEFQIALAAAADGQTAIVWDTLSGKQLGQGLAAIPTKIEADKILETYTPTPLSAERRRRQQLIFRSYDSMNTRKALKRSAY